MEFPKLKNDAILKVAKGEKPHRIPVWIMRQAGRYLPEFREIRKNHEFFDLVDNPELACEVTIQPINRYDLDAAIIFSDILVVPRAMGMEVIMQPAVGPIFPQPLDTPDDLKGLDFDCDVAVEIKGTLDAITLTRKRLEGRVPLIGFAGAPWTLLSYMIEGGGSKTLAKSKGWLYKYPQESARVLKQIGEVVIRYLVEQVKAGAQMLQIFESHADLLSPDLFHLFCKPVLETIEKETRARLRALGLEPVPMTIFAKGGHYAIAEISKTLNYDVVGIDWTVDPMVARSLAGPNTVLQGNLDPVCLFGFQESVECYTKSMVDRMGTSKFICNLGHGIYPETPTENVKHFIDVVHSYKL